MKTVLLIRRKTLDTQSKRLHAHSAFVINSFSTKRTDIRYRLLITKSFFRGESKVYGIHHAFNISQPLLRTGKHEKQTNKQEYTILFKHSKNLLKKQQTRDSFSVAFVLVDFGRNLRVNKFATNQVELVRNHI